MKKVLIFILIIFSFNSYGQDANQTIDLRIDKKISSYDSTVVHSDTAVFQTVGAQTLDAVTFNMSANTFLVTTIQIVSYNGKDLGGGERVIYANNVNGVITLSMRNLDGVGNATTSSLNKSAWTVVAVGSSVVIRLTGVISQTIKWFVYIKPRGI